MKCVLLLLFCYYSVFLEYPILPCTLFFFSSLSAINHKKTSIKLFIGAGLNGLLLGWMLASVLLEEEPVRLSVPCGGSTTIFSLLKTCVLKYCFYLFILHLLYISISDHLQLRPVYMYNHFNSCCTSFLRVGFPDSDSSGTCFCNVHWHGRL